MAPVCQAASRRRRPFVKGITLGPSPSPRNIKIPAHLRARAHAHALLFEIRGPHFASFAVAEPSSTGSPRRSAFRPSSQVASDLRKIECGNRAKIDESSILSPSLSAFPVRIPSGAWSERAAAKEVVNSIIYSRSVRIADRYGFLRFRNAGARKPQVKRPRAERELVFRRASYNCERACDNK